MKKLIIIIALIVGLVVIIVAFLYIYTHKQVELGKTFYIGIKEDEVIDYNAVDQDQYIDGVHRMWFDMIRDTEREKLSDYMKENNYKIVPGTYKLRQGYKFKDLLKELEFEEIT